MRRIATITLVTLLSLSMPLMAENSEFTGDQAEQFTQQMAITKERLKLTTAQEEAVKPILKASSERKRGVFKSYGFEPGKEKPELSFNKKRSLVKDLKVIKTDVEEQLGEVLSDDQMREYKAIQKENRSKFKDRMKSKS